MSLTAKQEAFARAVAGGASATDAYIQAYRVSADRSRTAIAKDAHEVSQNPRVQSRIDEMRSQLVDRVAEGLTYELEQAMAETARALALAVSKENPTAMVAAIKLRAQLNGLLVAERKNERTPVQGLGHDEAAAALEALLAIRKAKQPVE